MGKRTGRKKAAILCLLASLALGSVACSMGGREIPYSVEPSTQEVFRINDRSCTLAQAKIFLTNYQNLYGTVYGVNLWEQDFGENSLGQYVKDITLSQMAQIMSMNLLAEREGVALTEEEKKKLEAAADAYYGSLNQKEIDYMGATREDVAEVYRQYGLANKLYGHLTGAISDEVSDDEARVMEIQKIFVSTQEAADDVMGRLKSGSDFMTVASACNESGQIEGNVVRGQLPQAVEEAAFALQPEQVTDCIRTEDGFYVIKCVNNYNQELTDENKLVIMENRRKEAFENVYESYIGELSSTWNEELWDSVKIQVSDEIQTDSFFKIYEKYCR